MATNTLHIKLRAGAALAAAALAATFLWLPGSEAAASSAGQPKAVDEGAAGVAAPCPLRLPRPAPEPHTRRPDPHVPPDQRRTSSTPAVSRRLTVHPAVFARQMRWLKRHGYHTITQRRLFDALMCGRPLPTRPILITFDDGYRDTLFRASPVLVRLGMKATAYVITVGSPTATSASSAGATSSQLERRGVEIGPTRSRTDSYRACRTARRSPSSCAPAVSSSDASATVSPGSRIPSAPSTRASSASRGEPGTSSQSRRSTERDSPRSALSPFPGSAFSTRPACAGWPDARSLSGDPTPAKAGRRDRPSHSAGVAELDRVAACDGTDENLARPGLSRKRRSTKGGGHQHGWIPGPAGWRSSSSASAT